MIASQLIEQLQLLIKEHGDLPVIVDKTKIIEIGTFCELLEDDDESASYVEGSVIAFQIEAGDDEDRLEGF